MNSAEQAARATHRSIAIRDGIVTIWLAMDIVNRENGCTKAIPGAHASPRRRTGYTMRYLDLSMRMNRDYPDNKGRKIWLCRGKNLGDNPVIGP